MNADRRIEKLKEIVGKEVFATRGKYETAASEEGELAQCFDFSRILLRSEELDLVSDLFWEYFEKEYPFQIGGLESSSIPIIAGIVMKGAQKGRLVNGFFARKPSDEGGSLKTIEGELSDEKIVLVDDCIDQGRNFMRQVEVLEESGKKVDAIFVVFRFRDMGYYQYFHDKKIEIKSLFTPDDFSTSLAIKDCIERSQEPVLMSFKVEWYFKGNDPQYLSLPPKSAPAIDEERVYFGSDNGNFWAINQNDGTVVWRYQVFFGSQRGRAFSSPVLHKNMVYFGACDGNFYALDKETGKRKWTYMDADWIGSSPCIAPGINMVFVALEFGLWKKRGGIVALDFASGQKKWEYRMSGLTHSSPAYSEKYGMVICGCDDFSIYAFDARKGKLLWEFETKGKIKAAGAISERHSFVAFGSFDKHVYVLKIRTGELVYKIKTNEVCSAPLIREDRLYVASLDKYLYCIDLKTGKILWQFATEGRIFASPEAIGDRMYIGSDDGRLYELDVETGKNTAFFQATERITDKVAHNKKTGRVFLPTFANEVYCLTKTDSPSVKKTFA